MTGSARRSMMRWAIVQTVRSVMATDDASRTRRRVDVLLDEFVLARLLVDTAEKKNGKIVFFLEGGYDPEALKDSVRSVLNVLIDHPRRPAGVPAPGASYPEIDAFRAYFKPMFPTL